MDILVAWFDSILAVLLEPSKRLYWGFLLFSIGIIFTCWLVSGKKIHWRRIKATFFSSDYWLTRSSATDLTYLVFNTFLRVALLVPLFGSHLLGAMWVAGVFQTNLGTMPSFELPWWLIAAAYTGTFFIVEDLSRFSLHRLMHKVPFLWRFHKTHHSAEILTPLTLHRVHPVEMTLYYLRGLVVFSCVSGVFIYLAGKKLTAYQILGVDALGFLFNMAAANLRHSHIWLSFGRFEKWFISPAQHQIHHSKDPVHRDKNFGTCLACWDKWMGDWVGATRYQRIKFGIA